MARSLRLAPPGKSAWQEDRFCQPSSRPCHRMARLPQTAPRPRRQPAAGMRSARFCGLRTQRRQTRRRKPRSSWPGRSRFRPRASRLSLCKKPRPNPRWRHRPRTMQTRQWRRPVPAAALVPDASESGPASIRAIPWIHGADIATVKEAARPSRRRPAIPPFPRPRRPLMPVLRRPRRPAVEQAAPASLGPQLPQRIPGCNANSGTIRMPAGSCGPPRAAKPKPRALLRPEAAGPGQSPAAQPEAALGSKPALGSLGAAPETGARPRQNQLSHLGQGASTCAARCRPPPPPPPPNTAAADRPEAAAAVKAVRKDSRRPSRGRFPPPGHSRRTDRDLRTPVLALSDPAPAARRRRRRVFGRASSPAASGPPRRRRSPRRC